MTAVVLNTKMSTVEHETPNFNNLVKKTDYNTKISEIKKNISLFLIIINLWQI